MVRSYPATLCSSPEWLRGRLALARRLYGPSPDRVLGTVWWYSTSSVLVAPSLEALVTTGIAADPALEAISLDIADDGRLLDASSSRRFGGDLTGGGPDGGDAVALGRALGSSLAPVVDSLATVCGARRQALWAIAADSIANRALWAGQAVDDVDGAVRLVGQVSDGVGSVMPRPRFARVGKATVVRRVSCCLIDAATGQDKCTSCPNQHPDLRERRIRAALGA